MALVRSCTAFGATGVNAAGAAIQAPQPARSTATAHPLAVSGARLWAARYNGGSGDDAAARVAASPDGASAYVTGTSSAAPGTDAATIAYSAASGARLWVARYNSYGYGSASSMAVSPDGARVYITGISQVSPDGGAGYGTVAYNAATCAYHS